MAETRIAIIGYGKIAQDQHVPAIAADADFRLAAVVAPNGAPGAAIPVYTDHHALLAAGGVDAVAICTPAGPRHAIARDCLAAGLDVLLEKPPTTTLGALDDLADVAEAGGRVLFTAWHAQHAAAVARLTELLHDEGLAELRIDWLEDVEKWHPGQDWIWEAGGFSVFDAGINALSIASLIVPARLVIADAGFVLHTGGQQPIAATLAFAAHGIAGPLSADFDWRHSGDERWDVGGRTARGTSFLLSGGGAVLAVEGRIVATPGGSDSEYAAVYRRFAQQIAARHSSVDREPLRLLADAFLIARR